MDLLDQLRDLSVSRRRSLRDDDFFIDRLHHRYTVAILVLFCVIVTAHQYAGEPINCWVPAQFTSSFEVYTNRLCWLQNTYYVNQENEIPDDENIRRESMLKYYQWIHLILLFQALLFIIPRVIWRSLNDKCGIEVINYVDAAIKYEIVDNYQERDKIMDFLSNNMQRFINSKNNYNDKSLKYKLKRGASYVFFWTGKRYGNYLLILYGLIKALYLINVIGQLFLVSLLLGIQNYYLFGFEILSKMGKGVDLISSHYFPKVTHCDFKIRELGNDHHYTVQCVLVINIFTEKIYVILWFWFVILGLLTLYDLIKFLINNYWPYRRASYISKHVKVFNDINDNKNNKRIFLKFVHKFLKPDVVFVLQILSHNVNAMIVSEVVDRLWNKYCQLKRFESSPTNDSEINLNNQEINDNYSQNHTPSFPLNNNNGNVNNNKYVLTSSRDNQNDDRLIPLSNINDNLNSSVLYSQPQN